MSGSRICGRCNSCGSPGAANAPSAACVPEPRMWTTSRITAGTGSCSPIEATCRACATVAIAAKLRRKFTGGAAKTAERLGAPAWLPLRTGACGDLYRPPPRVKNVLRQTMQNREASSVRDFFPTDFGPRGKIPHHGENKKNPARSSAGVSPGLRAGARTVDVRLLTRPLPDPGVGGCAGSMCTAADFRTAIPVITFIVRFFPHTLT